MLDMIVQPRESCSNFYEPGLVTEYSICANGLFSNNHGACRGDVGGGLVTLGDSIDRTNRVIGIVSFISSRGCDSTDPNVFTRVSRYLKWINLITGITLDP